MNWKCTRCEVEFSNPALDKDGQQIPTKWWCADDEPHVVAAREYFILDSPGGRTIISNIPPGPLPDNWRPGADDERLGGVAEFIDGRFSTTDPEKQYWLEQRGGFCTRERWQGARPMTATQRLEFEISELQKEIAELRKETVHA